MEWNVARGLASRYFSDPVLVRGYDASNVLLVETKDFGSYCGPIDWSWSSDDAELDAQLGSISLQYQLNCNQNEVLMREAAALLDRALADLTRYDDLNVDRFKLIMEVTELDANFIQDNKEVLDDEYWSGLQEEARLAADAIRNSTSDSKDVSSYLTAAQKAYAEAEHDADYDNLKQLKLNARAAKCSAAASKLQYANSVSSSGSFADSHERRSAYEGRARQHQIGRRNITKTVAGLKLSEVMKPGGALNYNDRMKELGSRSLADFKEAYARLNAIALGMREFMLVDSPNLEELAFDLKDARTRIEGAVRWLRKAINAVGRARMNEQAIVVRMTVEPSSGRALVDELAEGKVVSFDAATVATLKSAQLRGVSASAEPLVGDSWVDLELKSPQQKLQYSDVTLPPVDVRLGRVSSSQSLNVRDVAGGRAISNRSPVGDWIVRAVRRDLSASPERLYIDFHLAAL